MKEFERIIHYFFLFITCVLFLFGCGNGEKYVQQGGAAAPTVDCFSCHATAQPSDPPSFIQADIIDTHFDLDTLGKCSVTNEETCSTDTDCPSGETCQFFPLEGYLLDTCGTCSITTTTACGTDTDCPAGETCVNGQVPSWALGTCSTTTTQLCRIDAGCPSGETCLTPTSYIRLFNSCESDISQRSRVASSKSCSASCHVYHTKDLKKNRQWKHSPHGDSASEPFVHYFTSGVCMRCHSGIGYAMYVEGSAYPSYTAPSSEQFPHQITCNGCHAGTDYASPENRRLRRSGAVTFISGGGATESTEGTISVGNSATCITCHQGRESGLTVFRTLTNLGVDPYDGIDEPVSKGFINSHYRASGATLFSKKGYEYQGKTYYNGNPFHQTMLCTGCHMAESDHEELGGHSFQVRIASGGINIKENISVCQKCHGTVTSFETIGALRDMDGDGALGSVKSEIEGLKAVVTQALAAGKSCGPLVNNQIFYSLESGYPYFFKDTPYIRENGADTWCESQLAAAFNLQFINTEPGVYAHNFRYAVQLLRDSYEDLTGTPLNGARPSSGGDRPATTYTP